MLFDGAGAMAAVDYPADVPAKTESAKGWKQKTPATAAPVTLASPAPRMRASPRGHRWRYHNAVLIVDTRVADHASLLATAFLPTPCCAWWTAGESGLNAVSQALAGLQGIESVQIISHGTPGSFTLEQRHRDAASVRARRAVARPGRDTSRPMPTSCFMAVMWAKVHRANRSSPSWRRSPAPTLQHRPTPPAQPPRAATGCWSATLARLRRRWCSSQAALAGYTGLLTEPTVTDMGLESPVSVGENAINTP